MSTKVSYPTTGSGVTLLVAANPNRFCLTISALSFGGTMFVFPDKALPTNGGIPLTTNNPFLQFFYSQHGEIVQEAWYTNGGSAGTIVSIMEGIWLPQVQV